ncbi:galactose mutarotase [Sulfitobacter albidus]|uniref:Galactose mutarotase n=1 Tax=Sulfitobacter albidus TaxID=2829501 RepID=A0A975JE30_9RHOB|nr:aldose epimerase family protein [Sulfitobacter albidus]QUJ76647.1 galactose mutarotase [Sulfitobacter albidus]
MQNNAMMPGDGTASFVISAGGLRARILSFGASLQDLRLDGIANPLVLSLPDGDYPGAAASLYAGAIVGPVAGRIAQARTCIGGRSVALDRNGGAHHLHGGSGALSHRVWTPVAVTPDALTLRARMRAGENGYPAGTIVYARYRVSGEGTLALTLTATCTRRTLMNLCHHPYFNLDGAPTIAGHVLECPATQYLPADADALPTGEIAPVAGTAFDFRAGRAVAAQSYDNSLCLHRDRARGLRFAAGLAAGAGPRLQIWTTQPALHVYDGAGIDARAADGRRLGPRAGLALEAQGWPDAPNNPGFPGITILPGEVYSHEVQYRFLPR